MTVAGCDPPAARRWQSETQGLRISIHGHWRMGRTTKGTHDGWEIREAGPANAPSTVLLLPGALCSGEFYEDVFAEPTLASHRLVAATVQGFGRTKAPDDLTIENYAHL